MLVKKIVAVEENDWKRLKAFSSRPENRRSVGIQGGLIIKEFLDEKEKSYKKDGE